MKVLGLILECNPLHDGHQYFINRAKQKVNPDYTIAIISGSFTMRGDCSIIDKFTKTKLLLNNGIDLIIELPIYEVLNSANYYGKSTTTYLSILGITDLAFGVENDDFVIINNLLSIMNSNVFQEHLSIGLKSKLSYKKACTSALEKINVDNSTIELFNSPNTTLALQYLSTINALNNQRNNPIVVHLIKREKETINKTFVSSKTIRNYLTNKQDIDCFIPYDKNNIISTDIQLLNERLFNLLKYQIVILNKPCNDYLNVDEGIENYLKNKIKEVKSYEELLDKAKNKRYTISRLQRVILSIVMEIPRYLKSSNQNIKYLRILGFNDLGKMFLKTIDENSKNKLITSLKNNNDCEIITELKATKLYGYLTGNDILSQEFQTPIIMSGGKSND